jgi:DtxR family transcriptional regulator, Mn-dependent transcriptional regulator
MVEYDQKLSSAIEDYLKAIYVLQQQGAQVGTVQLAEHMGFKPASVSGMVKKLSEMHLVDHTPYYGVVLTPAGEKIALETLRHHRLIELYLVEALGYTWDEVHEDAETLEHVISEKLEARIAERLGHPTHDPHGDPIPSPDGSLPPQNSLSLASLPASANGTILRVLVQEADRLRYLASLGLVLGATVTVVAREPFDGPLTVEVGETRQVLDSRLAATIFVEHV